MITNEPSENYTFEKDGMLILLLPFKKRKHHKALKTRSIFNKKPTEGLLRYLIRHQPTAAHIRSKGNALIGHLPKTPYGKCLSIFPGTHKLNKINIRKVPVLVIADKEMGKASFYSINQKSTQQVDLPLLKGKAFITRFSISKPCIVWIKPGIKIKSVIKGYYLHDTNSREVVPLPQFNIEQLLKVSDQKA